MNKNVIIDITSVSYTHLDVYKRQLLNINCDDPDKAQDILVNEFNIGQNYIFNAAQERRNDEKLILTMKIFLYLSLIHI